MDGTPSIRGNRYGAGASGIIEAGRQESQRLLMERYRRIDVDNNSGGGANSDVRRNRPKFVGSAAHGGHNYYSGGSVPLDNYSRNGVMDNTPVIDSSR